MKTTPLKTKVISSKDRLEEVIDRFVVSVNDGSILAVTSKIIAIMEGSTIESKTISKEKLIRREADFYLDSHSPYTLTIKENLLIPAAGIDESNSGGKFILWPKDPGKSAKRIRDYVADKFKIKNFGVIITDSHTSPLRFGTTGISIGHAGFKALKDYRNERDIFGRKLKVTQANYVDGLAAAAVLVMGEGSEQTPMALIENVPFVQFDRLSPTEQEIRELKISIDDDLYGSFLQSVPWKEGGERL